MLFDINYSALGWPKRDEVLNPSGSGPRLYADLVEKKIGNPLRRADKALQIKTGVLTADPSGKTSDVPLAIVCEFEKAPTPKTILELHRLAWNFCYSPLLVTFEPGLVRAWNCCEKPPDDFDERLFPPDNLKLAEHQVGKGKASLTEQAALTLHWVNLITGDFLRRKEADGCLKIERRADRMLLDNLQFIRKRLVDEMNLSSDFCHDLLARIIFVQFLCERKDSAGNAALGVTQFKELHEKRKLSQSYQDFKEILTNKKDTYALFRYLNGHFNGDLFPGKSLPRSQREAAWQDEMKAVQPKHLTELVKLLDGRLQAENNQLCLWRLYSFDTIPLEFISSVYEEFVTKRRESEQDTTVARPTKKGVVYTPGHLVDFVLDRVLPWGGKNWNLKILDPSAGSGIFLVKAFQRLMHRWRLANDGKPMTPKIPRRLLEKNLFGVDIDSEAIRVASFSLYLAMLDELDPKLYFQRTKFPNLYRRRLVDADFFDDSRAGFKTNPTSRDKYDLVIGNAPWGEDMMTATAAAWAKKHQWPVADKNVGPLFLAKGLTLTKTSGHVAMLQPAGALLVNYNSSDFRKRLFSEFKVKEVFNFSPLSRVLFEKADSPCALPVLRPIPPDGRPFYYCSPKRQQNLEEKYRIVVDQYDGHWVYQNEVENKNGIWPVLLWGGRREMRLIQDIPTGESLCSLQKKHRVFIREGFIRGDRKKRQIAFENRHVLEADDFPDETSLQLRAKDLGTTDDLMVHSRDSTKFRAFDLPQLLIKSSWTKETARFRAVVVQSSPSIGGVICKQSFVSVSAEPNSGKLLESACLLFNSKFAVFLLLLTSGRFAFYRTEPLVSDLLALPLPPKTDNALDGVKTFKDIDEKVRQLFLLDDSEWALVEDLCKYTLPDYRGDETSPGYQPTSRKLNQRDSNTPGVTEYCRYFIDVLRAGFGDDKNICATVFHETDAEHLSVRLVAIHLDWPGQQPVRPEALSNEELCKELQSLTGKARAEDRNRGTNHQGRTLRVYSVVTMNGRKVPTVFLVKPDQQRFWTRSMALRDADAVAADIMTWRSAAAENKSRFP
jgi:N-6 DNA Methylase